MSFKINRNSPLSPLMQCLLKGGSDACIAWFGTVERRIWDCVRANLPSEWIETCINLSMDGDICACPSDRFNSDENLQNLNLAIRSARLSLDRIDDQVIIAFCDDVMRFAATVWQSWQDGYDAGWEDGVRSCHAPATFVQERPTLDS